MPTSAAGSRSAPVRSSPVRRAPGFTLIELLLVLAIVAVASAGVGWAMRDAAQTQLETEAQRLVAVLESARAQSRASGVPVRWHATASGFAFEGLPEAQPQTWRSAGLAASSDAPLLLGPEPVIAPQQVQLWRTALPQHRLLIATDGVRPFAVRGAKPDAAP